MEKRNDRKSGYLWPALVLILVVLLLQGAYARRQSNFSELQPESGVLDLTGIDFSDEIYKVVNSWEYYPNKLYEPADFARGVQEKPVRAGKDISTDEVPFGTYRLVIRARPRQIYTICGFSMDYSTRVLVNGRETVSFGHVADNAAEAVPAGGYMTIPLDTGETGEVELLYQYANFVHTEGGFIPTTYLSTPQNIEAFKAGNALVSVGLSGAMVVLSLYFLLFASIQRQKSLLYMAVCCLLMALRDNLFWGTYLLPPETSWYLTYRTSLTVATLLPAAFLLLLNSLYPIGSGKAAGIYLGITAVLVFLLLLLDTTKSKLICTAAYVLSVPYLVYLLYGLVRWLHRQRQLQAADLISFLGLGIYLAAILTESVLLGRTSYATRFGFTPTGMLLCMLLLGVSISLRVQEQKAALVESRSHSQMLEQMNTMNLDFLHKVAHELKTPLTVISGYAQLTGLQLASNHVNDETPENLRTIHREALRLADMVSSLMEFSYQKQVNPEFGPVYVPELLHNAQAICAPICLKNENAVQLQEASCTVRGNAEMLLQIFINLAVNANRHTHNGTITLMADAGEQPDVVVFRVADSGTGISPEILPHIFEKRFSADGGNGLGLSICAEAIEAHGGRLWVEHTGPTGTIFAFTVPRTEG